MRSERGAVLVEYVLLLAIFIVGVAAAIGTLDESIEGETVETAAEIGGQAPPSVPTTAPWANTPTGASSVAPPPTSSTTSTTPPVSLPGSPPLVDAGPDNVIQPNQNLVQIGSASDPDGEAVTIQWTAFGNTATYVGPRNTETVEISWTKPGTHRVEIKGTDATGWVATDEAFITVTSGEITPTGIDESYWNDRNNWTPQIEIDLFNQYGERVALGSTVVVEFTKPDGSTIVENCVVNINGEVDCRIPRVNFSIDWVDAKILDITGPHIDSWQGFQPNDSIRLTPGPRPNDPPSIDVGGLITADAGVPFSITATASDPENDPLTHTWSVYRAGDGSTSGTSISNDTTLTPTITINQKGQHTVQASANDGHNPDVWSTTQVLNYTGSITAVVTDESYWVDHDTWVPQHAVEYYDSDGDVIVFDVTNNIDYVGADGRRISSSCNMEGARFVSNNWDECWNDGYGQTDVGGTPYVDAYTPDATTPFGITVNTPGTPTRLVPPTTGRPSPTTAPPPTTTTTPPATTTTTTQPTTPTTTTTVAPPPTTTTTTAAPTTTTTKKPKGPKGF